jgi:tetratricopeptide (TPR) repeat protein
LASHLCVLLAIGVNMIPGVPRCVAQSDALVDLYQQARAAQASGNLKEATQKYEQIVRLRPDMAEAHSNLGSLYFQQKQTEQAQRSFRTAIKLKPELAGPYFFLGVLAFDGRRYEEALKYLKQAESRDPTATATGLYLGYTNYARADYFEAVRDFQKVADADPGNPDVLYNLSKAYGQAAKHYFAELKTKYPASFHTHLAKGHVYETEGKWADAMTAYGLAADMMPSNPRLAQRLQWVTGKGAGQPPPPPQNPEEKMIDGSIRFFYVPPEAGGVRNELQDYRNMVAQYAEGTSAEKIYGLAEGYQVMSFLASMLVLEVEPNSYRTHQLKAEYYESLGKDEEAIQEYREALKLQPALVNVHFAIGNIYWKRNRLDEALPELMLELEVQPNHPEALYESGDVLFARGNIEEAERHFLKSLQFEPNRVETHLALEKIYTQMARYDSAVASLKKVIRLAPTDATPHYRLANIYRKLGKPAEAQQEMETFAKLRSQSPAK